MKLAIMQPYLFPYIGYFQMVNAVDKFILYDDVNFIKRGWINRNNILINNKKSLFTLNLSAVSQNKLINEISVNYNDKLLKSIEQSYKKAPFFAHVMPIIQYVFNDINAETRISEISGKSIISISNYLGINTEFEYSSKCYSNTNGLDRAQRLIEICKYNSADTYINAAGGKELYNKEEFNKENIKLLFIQSRIDGYKQFNSEFVTGLSMIDVLMFNSVEEVNKMLKNYELT